MYNLNVGPTDILIIYDKILLACEADECLQIYDKDFNLIKRIDKIDGLLIDSFSPKSIASNSNEKIIYICDGDRNRILMTDFDFNLIKFVGSYGIEDNQFSCPTDICYKNESLYICDKWNGRVQIYSKDLKFVESIKLDYDSWKIKASNDFNSIVYFYDLNDFSLIRSYKHGYGRISQINSCFYEFNDETKIVYCFDENGILKEEIILTGIDYLLTDFLDGTFIRMDECILMTSYSENKIIKFSKD